MRLPAELVATVLTTLPETPLTVIVNAEEESLIPNPVPVGVTLVPLGPEVGDKLTVPAA